MWSVQEAKARLSEVMRLARAGKPQVVGTRDPVVVVSAKDFARTWPKKNLGRFLVETAPRGAPIELPPRDRGRGDPFADA